MPSKPQCCYISKTCSGQYYACFPCEEEAKPLPKLDYTVGIDLGIKSLIVTSEGEVIDNKNVYRSVEKELAYEQDRLIHKKEGICNLINYGIANATRTVLPRYDSDVGQCCSVRG